MKNTFNQACDKCQGSERVHTGHGGSDDSPNEKERKKMSEERERGQVKTVADMISIFMKTLGWGEQVSPPSLSLSASPYLFLNFCCFGSTGPTALTSQRQRPSAVSIVTGLALGNN